MRAVRARRLAQYVSGLRYCLGVQGQAPTGAGPSAGTGAVTGLEADLTESPFSTWPQASPNLQLLTNSASDCWQHHEHPGWIRPGLSYANERIDSVSVASRGPGRPLIGTTLVRRVGPPERQSLRKLDRL